MLTNIVKFRNFNVKSLTNILYYIDLLENRKDKIIELKIHIVNDVLNQEFRD